MKISLTALTLALSASALTPRQPPCCFTLTATGGPGGPLGQLADGQNRVGQNFPPSTYCISQDSSLTDQSGRGCILTGPTSQFQCDTGVGAMSGFAVGCDGMLTYNGTSKFVACPTGDQGGFNVYVRAPQGQGGCVDVTLAADSCKAGCPSSTLAPPAPAAPVAAPTQKSCPPNLSGMWEFPHLIISVDESNPSKAQGTSYNGHVTSNKSTIFNFDFPASLAGKTCTLVFLLPTQDRLVTSSFRLSGSGEVVFAHLKGAATEETTWGNMPTWAEDYGTQSLKPGNGYVVTSFACPAGKREGYVMGAMLPHKDPTSLEWFQDYNPEPIGLYVSAC